MQICLEQSKQERSPASGLKESHTFRDSSHVQFQNVQVPQALQLQHCTNLQVNQVNKIYVSGIYPQLQARYPRETIVDPKPPGLT